MELNINHEHSDEGYPVPRESGFQDPLFELFKAAGLDNCYGIPTAETDFYGFMNNTFVIRPYDWESYCDCGFEHRNFRTSRGHEETCREVLPNFLYKPIGFKIIWYKYPLRDSYMNINLSEIEFRAICRECIGSIK